MLANTGTLLVHEIQSHAVTLFERLFIDTPSRRIEPYTRKRDTRIAFHSPSSVVEQRRKQENRSWRTAWRLGDDLWQTGRQ
jgi:hypothetical protein